MAGNIEGLRSLAKYSKLPIDRVRYLPDAGADIMQSIHRGVIFLMAFWSGPAVMAFAKLTEVVGYLDRDVELEIVVADVDGSPELYETLMGFKERGQGAGETAWIREGQIVAASGFGLNVECFEPNTRTLLLMP